MTVIKFKDLVNSVDLKRKLAIYDIKTGENLYVKGELAPIPVIIFGSAAISMIFTFLDFALFLLNTFLLSVLIYCFDRKISRGVQKKQKKLGRRYIRELKKFVKKRLPELNLYRDRKLIEEAVNNIEIDSCNSDKANLSLLRMEINKIIEKNKEEERRCQELEDAKIEIKK